MTSTVSYPACHDSTYGVPSPHHQSKHLSACSMVRTLRFGFECFFILGKEILYAQVSSCNSDRSLTKKKKNVAISEIIPLIGLLGRRSVMASVLRSPFLAWGSTNYGWYRWRRASHNRKCQFDLTFSSSSTHLTYLSLKV